MIPIFTHCYRAEVFNVCIRVTIDEVFLRKRWKFVLATVSWKATNLIEMLWKLPGKIGKPAMQFDSNKVDHKLWSKHMPSIKHNLS